MSTPGGVQYSGDITEHTGGCSVQWGYHEYSGDVQYSGGYYEYSGGYHDQCGGYLSTLGVFSTLGETMSTLGDTMMSVGGYCQYTGGCSVHWGVYTNSIVFLVTFPHIYHDILPVY